MTHTIIGCVWFGKIGIVLMNNGYEDKAYIESGEGANEEIDRDFILHHGLPFPVDAARVLMR